MMADRRRRSPVNDSTRRRREYPNPGYDDRERMRNDNNVDSRSLSSSSSSSYIDISRTYPRNRIGGALKTFFTAPSEHRRRVRRRKSSRVLPLGNSSSSSVNSDLAYGTGFLRKPKHLHTRSRKGKGKEIDNGRESDRERERHGLGQRAVTNAEILAVGVGLAELARKQNQHDLKTSRDSRRSETYIVNESYRHGEAGPSRGLAPSRISHGSDTFDEEDWESASEDESDFSVDSKLAYGSVVDAPSFAPNPRRFSPRRNGSIVDPRLFGPTNSLHGVLTEPVGFDDIDVEFHSDFGQSSSFPHRRAQSTASTSQVSLQQVYPIGTSDPSRFEAGQHSIVSVNPEVYVSSRPDPIPIQQPQPITRVSQSVYEPVYPTRSESGGILKKPSSSSSGRSKSLAEAALAGVAGIAIGSAISERKSERGSKSRIDDDNSSKRGSSSKSDSKEERRREQRGSPESEDRREKRREKEKEKEKEKGKGKSKDEESRKDKKREKRRDEEREETKEERRERRREERRSERGEDNRRTKSSDVSSSIVTRSVDPFQYQVADDAFPSPDINPPYEFFSGPRHIESAPTVVTVEREPDFSHKQSASGREPPASYRSEAGQAHPDRDDRDYRQNKNDIHDERRTLRDAVDVYEEAEHSTAPIAGAAIGAAVAAIAIEGYRESRSEKRRGERRGDYDEQEDNSRTGEYVKEPKRDPVQEDADRAYREIVMARKIASNVIRSRTPSPDRSVVHKYDTKDDDPEIIRIVTPPGMEDHKKKGPYDAPNADVQIDHILTPMELERFSSPIRTNAELSYFSRDYRSPKERPLLNLVQPTPTPSPFPEVQAARSKPEPPRQEAVERQVSRSEVAQSTQPKEEKYVTRSEAGRSSQYEDRGRGRSISSFDPDVASPRGTNFQSPTASTISKGVTWGENETKHYVVESPSTSPVRHRERSEKPSSPPTESNNNGWGSIAAGIIGVGAGAVISNGHNTDTNSKPKDDGNGIASPYEYRGVVVEPESPPRSPERRSPPATGPKPVSGQRSHIPGAFEDDLDFTATLAAGLQDTGFDPNIVINDPTFRRRTSPPGSNDPGVEPRIYQAPFAETVSDLNTFALDSPGHEGAPPVQGFVVGEIPDTPSEEQYLKDDFDEFPSKLSKKEQKKRDKAAKRQSADFTTLDETPPTKDIVQEPEDYFEPKLSKKEQKKRDKEAKRSISLVEEIIPADEPMVAQSLVEEPGSYFETPKKSKKKSKKGSSTYDDDDDQWKDGQSTVSVPVDAYDDIKYPDSAVASPTVDEWDTPKKKKKSKRDNDGFGSPSRPVPSSEVSSEVGRSSSKKSKDKSRRKSEQYDPEPADVPLPMATPSEVSRDDYDDRKTRRSHRDSGIFDSADRGDSRSVVSAGTSRYDDDEHRKSKKKHRSLRDDDDTKSIASAPAGDEWEDSKKSKKKEKRNSGGFFGLFGSKSEPEPKESPPKDDWDEPKRKKKSKRSSTTDSASDIYNGNGHANGTSSRVDLSNGDEHGGSRSDDELRKKDSFLAKAGTFGAGVGLAGAVAAIAAHHQQPKAAATTHEDVEASTSRESNLPFRQKAQSIEKHDQSGDVVDPEITQRYFRPSIDPQYGDLLPLPPSSPPSPEFESTDDLPQLPDSRPPTPEAARPSTRDRTPVRRSIQDAPLKSPSQSAVPLKFIMGNRSGQTSPVLGRSSPLASPTATNKERLVAHRSRPRPTSWDSTKEFKPLYLVENNRRGSFIQPSESADELPALPASGKSSRSSSQNLGDETSEMQSSKMQSQNPLPYPATALSIDTGIASHHPQGGFLDSEQSTPKAVDFARAAQTTPSISPVLLEHHVSSPSTHSKSNLAEDTLLGAVGSAALVSSLGSFASAHANKPIDTAWLHDLPSHSKDTVQYASPIEPMSKDRSSYLLHSSPPAREFDEGIATPTVENQESVMDVDSRALPNLEQSSDKVLGTPEGIAGNSKGDTNDTSKASEVFTKSLDHESGITTEFEPVTDIVLTKAPDDVVHEEDKDRTVAVVEDLESPDAFSMTRSKKDKKKDKKKGKGLSRASTFDDIPTEAVDKLTTDESSVMEEAFIPDTKAEKKKKKKKGKVLSWETEPEPEPIPELETPIESSRGDAEEILTSILPSLSSNELEASSGSQESTERKSLPVAASADDQSGTLVEGVAHSALDIPRSQEVGVNEGQTVFVPDGLPDVVAHQESPVPEKGEETAIPDVISNANLDDYSLSKSKRGKKKKSKSAVDWSVEPSSDPSPEVTTMDEEPEPELFTTPTSKKDKKKKKKGLSISDWEPDHGTETVVEPQPADIETESRPELEPDSEAPIEQTESLDKPVSKKDKKKKKKGLSFSDWDVEPQSESMPLQDKAEPEPELELPIEEPEPFTTSTSKKDKKKKKNKAALPSDWTADQDIESHATAELEPVTVDVQVVPEADLVADEPTAVFTTPSSKEDKKNKKGKSVSGWELEPEDLSREMEQVADAPESTPSTEGFALGSSKKSKKKVKGTFGWEAEPEPESIRGLELNVSQQPSSPIQQIVTPKSKKDKKKKGKATLDWDAIPDVDDPAEAIAAKEITEISSSELKNVPEDDIANNKADIDHSMEDPQPVPVSELLNDEPAVLPSSEIPNQTIAKSEDPLLETSYGSTSIQDLAEEIVVSKEPDTFVMPASKNSKKKKKGKQTFDWDSEPVVSDVQTPPKTPINDVDEQKLTTIKSLEHEMQSDPQTAHSEIDIEVKDLDSEVVLPDAVDEFSSPISKKSKKAKKGQSLDESELPTTTDNVDTEAGDSIHTLSYVLDSAGDFSAPTSKKSKKKSKKLSSWEQEPEPEPEPTIQDAPGDTLQSDEVAILPKEVDVTLVDAGLQPAATEDTGESFDDKTVESIGEQTLPIPPRPAEETLEKTPFASFDGPEASTQDSESLFPTSKKSKKKSKKSDSWTGEELNSPEILTQPGDTVSPSPVVSTIPNDPVEVDDFVIPGSNKSKKKNPKSQTWLPDEETFVEKTPDTDNLDSEITSVPASPSLDKTDEAEEFFTPSPRKGKKGKKAKSFAMNEDQAKPQNIDDEKSPSTVSETPPTSQTELLAFNVSCDDKALDISSIEGVSVPRDQPFSTLDDSSRPLDAPVPGEAKEFVSTGSKNNKKEESKIAVPLEEDLEGGTSPSKSALDDDKSALVNEARTIPEEVIPTYLPKEEKEGLAVEDRAMEILSPAPADKEIPIQSLPNSSASDEFPIKTSKKSKRKSRLSQVWTADDDDGIAASEPETVAIGDPMVEQFSEPEILDLSSSKKSERKSQSVVDWADEAALPEPINELDRDLQNIPDSQESIDLKPEEFVMPGSKKNKKKSKKGHSSVTDNEPSWDDIEAMTSDATHLNNEVTTPSPLAEPENVEPDDIFTSGSKKSKKKAKKAKAWELDEPESETSVLVSTEVEPEPMDDFVTPSKKSKKKAKKNDSWDVQEDHSRASSPGLEQTELPDTVEQTGSKKNKKRSKKAKAFEFDDDPSDALPAAVEETLESGQPLPDLVSEELNRKRDEVPEMEDNHSAVKITSAISNVANEEAVEASNVESLPSTTIAIKPEFGQEQRTLPEESAALSTRGEIPATNVESTTEHPEIAKSGLDVGYNEEQLRLAKQMQEDFSSGSKKSKKDKKKRQSSLPPAAEFDEPRSRGIENPADFEQTRSLSADPSSIAVSPSGSERQSLYSEEQLKLARELKAEQESGGKKSKKDKKKRSGLSQSAIQEDFLSENIGKEFGAVPADDLEQVIKSDDTAEASIPDGLAAGYQEDQLSLARQLQAEFGSTTGKKSKKEKKGRSTSRTPVDERGDDIDYFGNFQPKSTGVESPVSGDQITPTGDGAPDGLSAGYREEQLELARQLKEEFGAGSKKSKKDKKRQSLLRSATTNDGFTSDDFVTPMEEPQQISFSPDAETPPADEFSFSTKKSKKEKKRQNLLRSATATDDDFKSDDFVTPMDQFEDPMSLQEVEASQDMPADSDNFSLPTKKSKKDKKGKNTSRAAAEDELTPQPLENPPEESLNPVASIEPSMDEEFTLPTKKSKKDKKRQSRNAVDDEPSFEDTTNAAPEESMIVQNVSTEPELDDGFSLPAKKSKKDKKRKSLVQDTFEESTSEPRKEIVDEFTPQETTEIASVLPGDEFPQSSKKSKKDKKRQSKDAFSFEEPVDTEGSNNVTEDSCEALVSAKAVEDKEIVEPQVDPEDEFAFVSKKSKKDKKRKSKLFEDDVQEQSSTGAANEASNKPEKSLMNEIFTPETAPVEDEYELTSKKSKKDKKRQSLLQSSSLADNEAQETSSTPESPMGTITQTNVMEEPAAIDEAEFPEFSTKKSKKDKKKKRQSILDLETIEDLPSDAQQVVVEPKLEDTTAETPVLSQETTTESAIINVAPVMPEEPATIEESEFPEFSTKKSKQDKKKKRSSILDLDNVEDSPERDQEQLVEETEPEPKFEVPDSSQDTNTEGLAKNGTPDVTEARPAAIEDSEVPEISTKKSKKDKKEEQQSVLDFETDKEIIGQAPQLVPEERKPEFTTEALETSNYPTTEFGTVSDPPAIKEAILEERLLEIDTPEAFEKQEEAQNLLHGVPQGEQIKEIVEPLPTPTEILQQDQPVEGLSRKQSKKDKRKRQAAEQVIDDKDIQGPKSSSWADEMEESEVTTPVKESLQTEEAPESSRIVGNPTTSDDFFRPTKKGKKGKKKNQSWDEPIPTAGIIALPTETESSRGAEDALVVAQESAQASQGSSKRVEVPVEEHDNRTLLAAAGAAVTATALLNAETEQIGQDNGTKTVSKQETVTPPVATPSRKLSKKEKRKKIIDKRAPQQDDIFDDPLLWEGADPKAHEEVHVVDDDGSDGFWSPPARQDEEMIEPVIPQEASPLAEQYTSREKAVDDSHIIPAQRLPDVQAPDTTIFEPPERDIEESGVAKEERPELLDKIISVADQVKDLQEGPYQSQQSKDLPDEFTTPTSKRDKKQKKLNRQTEYYAPAEATSDAEILHAEPVDDRRANIISSSRDLPLAGTLSSPGPLSPPTSAKFRRSGLGLPVLSEEIESVPAPPDNDRDSAFITDSPIQRQGGFSFTDSQEHVRDSGVHLRDYSPGPERQSVTSTDDALARLSWPSVNEETETVDLNRSLRSPHQELKPPILESSLVKEPRKLKENKYIDLRSVSPLAERIKLFENTVTVGGTVAGRVSAMQNRSQSPSFAARDAQRPSSVQSQRSVSNVNRLRTPEPLSKIARPDSVGSNRSAASSTPSLRRSGRQISGDLRSLSQHSNLDLAKEAELAAISATAVTAASPPTSNVSATPVNPTANEGRARTKDKDMADVYDGFGEGRLGSPRSPTRPHSMRRRQSMQVLDLESRVDQLAAENRMLADAKAQAEHILQTTQHASAVLADRDAEIDSLKASLDWLHKEVNRLTEVNHGLTSANTTLGSRHNDEYGQLEAQHAQIVRELQEVRAAHDNLASGMEGIVRNEVQTSMEAKDREIEQLRSELETAKTRIRAMQREILASKANDSDFLVVRDEDYFDTACQQLCQHVQQWVLRFSKFSDMRACRLTSEINNDKTIDRLDNAILDGSDVDSYLKDRVKRRDVFMSMTMTMVWEFVFTRYLFGMDREQRQKLKSLEKLLLEVGPPSAVHQWRATTLTLLSKRGAFLQQREQDTEAVVSEILNTLFEILPPPSQLEDQIGQQLRRVMKSAVDLSIEMRTQRAEYMMLPPLQPEYDANGDLASKVTFNAALMNERSGDGVSNEDLETQKAIVRIVLFPLVVKKGDDKGAGDEEIVVCPAQVLVAKPKKTVRVFSPGSVDNRSRISMQSSMPAGEYGDGMENSI